MKSVKATVIVTFLAMGATLVVLSASAQQPTPFPHVPIGIPTTPPPGWNARQWTTLRAHCQEIADKSSAHQPLTRDDWEVAEECGSLAVPPPPPSPWPSSISSNAGSARITPAPTPLPKGPAAQSSTDPPVIGPFGTPFTGTSQDACQQETPPDVASDVSPGSNGQIVELLNDSGLLVFNKQGTMLNTAGTLTSFWQALSPQPHLTDTQVAWDPFSQRWLVTTLSLPNDNSSGDLFFAFSKSSDASLGTTNWNYYKVTYNSQGVCSGFDSTHPTPDQPIIGYNQTWVAIALRCLLSGGVPPAGTDQLVLIPRINGLPAPLTSGQIQKANAFFNARPSRDVSAIGDQPLFLVAPEVTASTLPYVQVTSVDASGNFVGPGKGGVQVHSPGNGVLGTSGSFAPAQHDTCGSGAQCDVDLKDGRITSVILQIGNDGDHYLLTSFPAGDNVNNTVQALYFIGQVESFANDPNGIGQWDGWYIDGPSFWAGYPTITMDDDFDIVSTFQTFYLNSNIYPNWYIDKGFIPNNNSFAQNPPGLGYGILANTSRSSYYGKTNCTPPGSSLARWGDYVSTIWDPNLGSPNEIQRVLDSSGVLERRSERISHATGLQSINADHKAGGAAPMVRRA
jgi:hypothetical protein